MSNPTADGARYYLANHRHGRQRVERFEEEVNPANHISVRTRFHKALNHLVHHEPNSQNDLVHHEDDDSINGDNNNDEGSERQHRMLLWRRRPDESDPTKEEQDRLPSSNDLQDSSTHADLDEQEDAPTEEAGDEDEQQTFFANPFNDADLAQTQIDSRMSIKEPLLIVPKDDEEASTEDGSPTQHAAREYWGKTVEKVKMIANIQSLPNRDSFLSPTVSAGPVFEPPLIAFSADEYGRKLPPILLSMISVTITDSEYLGKLGQWTFRTELQYGDTRWVIKRTIADFMTLHYKLKVKSSLSDYVPSPPPFPDELGNLISSARTTIGMDRLEDGWDAPGDREVNNVDPNQHPRPSKYEVALARRKKLTTYLRELLAKAHTTVSYDICEFFEISAASISKDMGWKGKEGYLENRVRISSPGLFHCWRSDSWTEEWVLLRDSYIAFFSSIASPTPSDVFLIDKTFSVKLMEPSLFHSLHLKMGTRYREVEIKGRRREMDEWMANIDNVTQNSPWIKAHRHKSFAPIRYNAKVKWFVDGENHFNAVAEAILSAKNEIYITDWWLTPELYLRRPPEKNQEFRLDRLLQRKAEEGVKIYVIVYKEVSLALTIDSAHTKKTLQGLHPNIIVQRHPDRRPFERTEDVYFWSHHDKIVVVDNRLAFLGGLDICFGRYDTHAHHHADYPAKGHQYQTFPGQDYSSPRVKDFAKVSQHDVTLVDREITPRMPWHDLSCAVVGPIARDVSRLFIERWNFLKSTKSMHRKNLPFLMPKGEYVAKRDESKFRGTCKAQLLRSAAYWSSGTEREHSIYNAYLDLIANAKHYIYIENQFFISATGDDKDVHNRIGETILNRIMRAHYEGEKFKVFILLPLIPAFEGDLASSDSMAARGVMHFQYVSISRGGASICEKLREEGIDPLEYIGWYSLRNWDKIAPQVPEKRAAENGDGGGPEAASPPQHPSDPTMLTLAQSDQISLDEEDDRGHYVSELVYIHDKIMIVDDRSVLIASANINDRSMLGHRDSEVGIVIEDKEMIQSYMNGKPYKAAKFAHTLRMQLWKEHLGVLDFKDWSILMDPGDKGALQTRATEGIGYNNSASGYFTGLASPTSSNDSDIRDYEADEAVHVLDRVSRTKSIYDKFSHSPRGHHLKEAAALDPLSDRFYHHIWRKTAETNTLVYRDLFRCVPDDTVHTFNQHRQFVATSNVPYGHVADPDLPASAIQEKLSVVRGHLVQFPIDYLKDEHLMTTVESLAPMNLYT